MFLLCSSSGKDRWGRPGDEDDSVSNSASDTITHSHSVCYIFPSVNKTEIFLNWPVKLSSSLWRSLRSLKEFMSPVLSESRSQRGDSGNTPGILETNKLIFKCWQKEDLHRVTAWFALQTARLVVIDLKLWCFTGNFRSIFLNEDEGAVGLHLGWWSAEKRLKNECVLALSQFNNIKDIIPRTDDNCVYVTLYIK